MEIKKAIESGKVLRRKNFTPLEWANFIRFILANYPYDSKRHDGKTELVYYRINPDKYIRVTSNGGVIAIQTITTK